MFPPGAFAQYEQRREHTPPRFFFVGTFGKHRAYRPKTAFCASNSQLLNVENLLCNSHRKIRYNCEKVKTSPDFIDFLRSFFDIVRQSFLHSNCPQDNLERNGNGQKLEKENEIMRKRRMALFLSAAIAASALLTGCGIRQHGGKPGSGHL